MPCSVSTCADPGLAPSLGQLRGLAVIALMYMILMVYPMSTLARGLHHTRAHHSQGMAMAGGVAVSMLAGCLLDTDPPYGTHVLSLAVAQSLLMASGGLLHTQPSSGYWCGDDGHDGPPT